MEDQKKNEKEIKLSNKELEDLLERVGGAFKNSTEKAAAYFDFLKEIPLEKQIVAFEIILNKNGHHETKKSGKRYNVKVPSEMDVANFAKGMGKLFQGHWEYILYQRPASKKLAEYLWNVIAEMNSDEEKILALTTIIQSYIIPYIQIPSGGVKLNAETHEAMKSQMYDQRLLTTKILQWPGLEDTERMSLCLSVILDQKSIEERTVVLDTVVKYMVNRAIDYTKHQYE